VLVLNFSTLSTIAAVAAAPMVPIWRRVTGMDRQGEAFSRETEDRTRGRIILSIALLTTIVLQWCWAVIMFVHPYYAQIPVRFQWNTNMAGTDALQVFWIDNYLLSHWKHNSKRYQF
jgi:hypothetical protein